jgi:hypothetical protein
LDLKRDDAGAQIAHTAVRFFPIPSENQEDEEDPEQPAAAEPN